MDRKKMVLPAVIGLLAPALAACGGSGGSAGGGDAIVVGTTDRFVSSEEAPYPFDPVAAYDVGSWNVLRHTMQTLMRVPRGGGEPVPEAADKCGFADRQNEQFRCTLRSGMKFADGGALTAEDVKYSIDRVLRIKYEEGPYGLLSNVDKVEVSGDLEVIFHLKTPDATFPYKLSTPVAAIVSEKHYEKNKIREGFGVDGSGPYTMRVEAEGDGVKSVVFTKNPEYKGSIETRNEKVELRSFKSAEAMGSAIENSGIDMMSRTMTPQQIRELDSGAEDGISLVEMPGLEIRYLAFNTADRTVRNKAVRQAVAQVVDRSALTTEVYGDTAEPLYSLVPATVNGHQNSFFDKYGEPDPDKAAALLADAGVETPVRLTLNYTTDHYGSATKKEFEALQKQLGDSGLFEVDVHGAEWSEFRPAQAAREYAVYGMGWFPDFPDADNYVAPFLAEDNFLNSPYANPTIQDTLIPRTRREAERSVADRGFQEIQDIVAEDVPYLPLWQGKQYVAARDDITGVEWAINSSSELQLWELGRGVSG
ncbi:ABC transporter substrate-binding protein [Streptomyces sp. GC420]|uniref:ABC transporter substrate-binding protein n=1 Tax=Streptomyces sp. GC420 TaxID=2697568 RepID=UPI001414FF7C|nr:ABC transporter substrate-binding protein [Streptomyces sp. GC420]NBM14332.1 peptide-binding protein [Streptomyces sp. GC420]